MPNSLIMICHTRSQKATECEPHACQDQLNHAWVTNSEYRHHSVKITERMCINTDLNDSGKVSQYFNLSYSTFCATSNTPQAVDGRNAPPTLHSSDDLH